MSRPRTEAQRTPSTRRGVAEGLVWLRSHFPDWVRARATEALTPLAIFGASRLVTLLVAQAARLLKGKKSIIDVLSAWDGGWYLSIAQGGYNPEIPPPPHQSNIGFFPGYPVAIRVVSRLTTLSHPRAALIVSVLSAALAAILLWFLTQSLVDRATAIRAVALFSFFPGAYVFSMMYSEGLFILLAIACLFGLSRRNWIVAGVAAALAGATRPNGFVLGFACAWAAFFAIKRRREWRSLVAPLLTPIGILGYFLFLQRRTGNFLIWFEAERFGWDARFDFGADNLSDLGRFLSDPGRDFNRLMFVLTIVVTAATGVALARWKPPAILTIYAAGIIGSVVLSSGDPLRPRNILTAFPLVIALGRELKGNVFNVSLAVSAGAMTFLMFIALTSLLFTP